MKQLAEELCNSVELCFRLSVVFEFEVMDFGFMSDEYLKYFWDSGDEYLKYFWDSGDGYLRFFDVLSDGFWF